MSIFTKNKVVIVHGCTSDKNDLTFNKHWMPWLKKELEKLNFKVKIPKMPETWKPNYNKFKKEFEKNKIDEDTILIGHSCGCAFIVRWLGETKQKIKKLILIAPWKIYDKDDKIRKEFYNYKIDENIKKRVKEIIMFTSNNEEEDGKKSLKIFQKELGGKIIELKNKGHYAFEDMGSEEFPELLKEII